MKCQESPLVYDGEYVNQPLSFIGLPVLCVPVKRPGALPLGGVQIIGAPYSEAVILRVAAVLEAQGIVSAELIGP
jgi:Asp-tRNA(Asn)/Glu-tRNA(Gln) amidotransferase A subunit family amidase